MLSLVLLLTLAVAPVPAGAALESPSRHVRGTIAYVDRLLKNGFYRSPTFAQLVARIEGSDVIVYVELVPSLPAPLEGRLFLMAQAHGHRYVRIQIAKRDTFEDTIALLGHELQHAAEVAEATEVVNQTRFEALYARIGIVSGEHRYETEVALKVGRQVRKELA